MYDRSNPKNRYVRQMYGAKQRGIDWEFTFDTWFKVWEESGHYNQMGRKKDEYCMARTNDSGPYSPSNVRITTVQDNHRETVLVTRVHTAITNQSKRIA